MSTIEWLVAGLLAVESLKLLGMLVLATLPFFMSKVMDKIKDKLELAVDESRDLLKELKEELDEEREGDEWKKN